MGQASGKEKQDDSVDGGALVPQGVYTGPQDYSHDGLKSFIYDRKLAPFYKGSDDEDTYKDAPENTECPICFLVCDRRECLPPSLPQLTPLSLSLFFFIAPVLPICAQPLALLRSSHLHRMLRPNKACRSDPHKTPIK